MQQKFAGLNKEFERKDVERMRNLIQGKANSSSENQIGYKKKTTDYKEGDIWKENKKTWTIKNGIKQTISKLDKIKKEVFVPLCCPKCNKVIKNQLDKDNYKIHKKCHDCVVEFEHKLRYTGKYDDYIKELKAKNSLNMVDDLESYLLSAVNETNEGYVSEQGTLERWVGGIDKEKMTKEIIEGAKIRRESIKKELNGKKVKRTNK
jgi:bacterioferritin-associated ferredoxin